MNFFLDENFPRVSAELLEEQGHTVYDIRGTEREGSTDSVLFEEARKVNAIFLTTDRDFYHTIPLLYPEHAGIIVITLAQPNSRKIVDKLQTALCFISNFTIESNVVLLTDNKIFTIKK